MGKSAERRQWLAEMHPTFRGHDGKPMSRGVAVEARFAQRHNLVGKRRKLEGVLSDILQARSKKHSESHDGARRLRAYDTAGLALETAAD